MMNHDRQALMLIILLLALLGVICCTNPSVAATDEDQDSGSGVVKGESRLTMSTYFGGERGDHGLFIEHSPDGGVILCGSTSSDDLPVTSGAAFLRPAGERDIYVAKFDRDNRLVFSTYIGGNDIDEAEGIHVDEHGNVYVVGYTISEDWPVTEGAFQPEKGGYYDSFVCVLSSDGRRLIHSTYLGGSSSDHCRSIDVMANGSIVVAGSSSSYDFPVTAGSPELDWRFSHPMMAIMSRDLSSVQLATFIDVGNSSRMEDMKVGHDGSVYMTGSTNSGDFPVTQEHSYVPKRDSERSAFVIKWDVASWALGYSTVIGGTEIDHGKVIEPMEGGRCLIVGHTNSLDFPRLGENPGFLKGYWDIFICEVDGSGALLNSSFLGGWGKEFAEDVALDERGNIYITGHTSSEDLPTSDLAVQQEYGGGEYDAACWFFNLSRRQVDYLTYLGGNRSDSGNGILLDGLGSVIMAGGTNSPNFPIINESSHSEYDGMYYDAFITKIHTDIVPPTAEAGEDIDTDIGTEIMLSVESSSDDFIVVHYRWTFETDDGTMELHGQTVFYEFDDAGTYEVSLNVSDGAGNWYIDTLTVTVKDTERPMANAGIDVVVDQGIPLVLNGSESTDNVGIEVWTWTFESGGNNVVLEGQAPSYTFDIPGIYVLHLTVEDGAGYTAQDKVEVLVNDIEDPVAVVQGKATIEEGTSLFLDGSSSTDNVLISSYDWTIRGPGGTKDRTGVNVSHTFEHPGIYNVTLVVTDSWGNSNEATFDVEVTEEDESPGFGLAVALATLVLASLVVRRRR